MERVDSTRASARRCGSPQSCRSAALLVAVTIVAVLGLGSATPGAADTEPPPPLPLSWVRDSPVLTWRDAGESVREWQDLMNEWLAVAAPDDPYRLELDGTLGPITDGVTRRFQAASGLPVDGIVGPATRAALLSSPALINAGAGLAAHEPALGLGDAGPAVAEWQSSLDAWFNVAQDQPGTVVVDGVFGVLTANATRVFQRSQGVTIDGIVGPETRAALTSAPALANAAPAAATPTIAPTLTPAAGVCASADTAIVEILLGPDVAMPRCVIVVGGLHWLRIVNDGPATRVAFGSFIADLASGATVTTNLPIRAYVDMGSRSLVVARYGDSGPDVVVK